MLIRLLMIVKIHIVDLNFYNVSHVFLWQSKSPTFHHNYNTVWLLSSYILNFQSRLYNHKCLFVRPLVSLQNPSTAWNHHPSSFIIHPSSFFIHPSLFFINLHSSLLHFATFKLFSLFIWTFISKISAFCGFKGPYFRNESWNWKCCSCLSL